MMEESGSLTNRGDQIEALLQAKSEVQEKLSTIFSDEHERLTEVLQNMMLIDYELTAQILIGPMREVITPLTNEAKSELLEQIWTAVQDDFQGALPEQTQAWQSHDEKGEHDERKGES